MQVASVAPLLAIGACSLIWQVASARAILAGLHGNELTLGLVLGCWLVLTGLATALAARLAPLRRHAAALLPLVLLLLPAGVLASHGLQQATLPAVTAVGQVVGPGRALLSALLCLLPCCVPLGLAFGLLALLAPSRLTTARWAARLFVWESLGTVAAGLLFHYWLAGSAVALSGLVGGGLCWLAAMALLRNLAGRTWRAAALAVGLCGGLALLYLVPGLPLPGARLLRPGLPGYTLLEQRNSPHAALAVLQRGDQVLFLASGMVVFSNQDEQRAEAELHLALLAHPAPRRVLMIGGGLGGGLAEALAHPVERVDYVELDPVLMELARKWGGPRLRRALEDRRVHLQIGDGRQVVREAGSRYDVILVGMPGPSSALVNRFYTVEFLRQVRRALRPGGLVRVTLQGSETYLGDPMAVVHASVKDAMRQVFGNVVVLPAAVTLMLAGKTGPVDTRFVTLVRAFRARSLATSFFGETELMDRTLALKHEHYEKRLQGVPPLVNTDLHPAVYFHASLEWLALSVPGLAQRLQRWAGALQARAWTVPVGAFLLALLWGLYRRWRGGAAAGFAMAAAGLSGLAVELCVLLAAQEVRGVVYHEIGALLAAFMAGLAAGAPLGRLLATRWPGRALQLAVTGCGLVSLAAIGTTVLAVGHPRLALLLGGQMVLLGAAVGACYPPASAALAARGGATAAARAYAWDLLGAAVGALLGSGFALPVLGLPGTALVCAALCLGIGATVGRTATA